MKAREMFQPIRDMYTNAFDNGVKCPKDFYKMYLDLLIAATQLEHSCAKQLKQAAKTAREKK